MDAKQTELANKVRDLTGQEEDVQHGTSLAQQAMALNQTRLDSLSQRADQEDAHLALLDKESAPPPPPPPPPPTTGSASGDFKQAVGFLQAGQTDTAILALQAYVKAWPKSKERNEAWYRLGLAYVDTSQADDAIAAFAHSLEGWPSEPWAGDATIELATVLNASHRPKESCQAVSAFDEQYARKSDAKLKDQARALEKTIPCR
ncbi:MAG: tetratricopeptide repeat protein [Asticcacaulis sp.]|uniref:tetratricopeptide repeat protein n=1 Tax=Asticcacaulis sp. TaxID=1872648 RepID=UPI003F7C9C77